MKRISSEQSIYCFSKKHCPVTSVLPGETIKIETMDCFSGQICNAEDSIEALNWERINPATGPIYIEGAGAGDLLKVSILQIDIEDQGVVASMEGEGVYGHRLTGNYHKLIPIKDGKAYYDDIELPLNPMIGVIGVAPAEGAISCGTPGSHGGNMDNKRITIGSVLYLPVAVEGALFAVGDLHACMGDGEIGVSGVEIPGVVTVKLELIKGRLISNPILEDAESYYFISSAETLDAAVEGAVNDAADLLCGWAEMPLEDVSMLLSLCGNLEICQVVDPKKTVRFQIAKKPLEKYHFHIGI